MTGKAIIHINGVNYEYAYPVDGNQSREFHELETKINQLTSGKGGPVTFDVLMGGQRTTLRVATQGVFAGALFLAKDGAEDQRVVVMR